MHPPQTKPLRTLYDPPVNKTLWILEERIQGSQVFNEMQQRAHLADADWQRMLWHGGLHINGKRCAEPPDWIEAGSTVVVYAFDHEPAAVLPGEILFEDHDLLAVNKPAWLPVQGSRASMRFSLETIWRETTQCSFLSPVHRLDRQTSGVLLFAKNSGAAARLGKQFAAGRVVKKYLAVVDGCSTVLPAWNVEGWMVRALHPKHSFFVLEEKETPEGKLSETSFVCLGAEGNSALILAMPKTGRTHQIRVHLKASGCPILGDSLYGVERSDVRLQLHAWQLSFDQDKTLTAPPPYDFGRSMQNVLNHALLAQMNPPRTTPVGIA